MSASFLGTNCPEVSDRRLHLVTPYIPTGRGLTGEQLHPGQIAHEGEYPAFYRGHERIGSDTYWHMMRLRKIWAEGSFSVLKREHCLSKVRKRGIPAVTEECLLSAMALNLKRMVKTILLTSRKLKIWTENIRFQSRFLFLSTGPISFAKLKRGQKKTWFAALW